MGYDAYFDTVGGIIDRVRSGGRESLERAADLVADAVIGGGIIHAFGAGHSHMMVEELFARAGGLSCVNGILEPCFMPHTGADKANRMERVLDLARIVFEDERIEPGDVMILVSQSGINPVIIEFARLTRERGVPIIAVTSVAHSRATPSRHPSQARLYELADVVLDNGCPVGDAAMAVDGLDVKVAAMSTVMGTLLLQGLVYLTVERMVQRGYDPPIRISRNLAGTERQNLQFKERYGGRIKRL